MGLFESDLRERISPGNICGNDKCKGPEAGVCRARMGSSKEVGVAGVK